MPALRAKAAGKHCGRPGLKPELAQANRDALAVPGRPGIRVIAKQLGVSPMTVQNVGRAGAWIGRRGGERTPPGYFSAVRRGGLWQEPSLPP